MGIVNNLLNVSIEDRVFRSVLSTVVDDVLSLLPAEDREFAKGVMVRMPEVPVAAADSYFMYYSVLPILRSSNPNEFLETVRKAMDAFIGTEDFKGLHALTELNDELSRVYAASFMKGIIEKLKKKLDIEDVDKLREEGRKYSKTSIASLLVGLCGQQGKDQRKQNRNKDTRSSQSQQHMQRQGSDTQQQRAGQPKEQPRGAEGGSSRLPSPTAVEDRQEKLTSALTSEDIWDTMNRASRTVRNYEEVRGFLFPHGVSKDFGTLRRGLGLAERLLRDVDVREIVSLARRLESSMMFESILKVRGRFGDEVDGYCLTKYPTHALPRELALPDELFYYRMASQGLLSKVRRYVAEGAYYVLLDKSGSMEGTKTVWARSVALAVFKKAMRKRVKFFLRFFDARVHELLTDPADVVEHIVDVHSNGGTDISKALLTAVHDLTKNPEIRGKVSTVIIITDGEDRVTVEPKVFTANRISLVAVMTGGHNTTLQQLAMDTGGTYLSVKPTKSNALELIKII